MSRLTYTLLLFVFLGQPTAARAQTLLSAQPAADAAQSPPGQPMGPSSQGAEPAAPLAPSEGGAESPLAVTAAPTVESLRGWLKSLQADEAAVPEEFKAELANLLQLAATRLDYIERLKSEAEQYQQRAEAAPAELQMLRNDPTGDLRRDVLQRTRVLRWQLILVHLRVELSRLGVQLGGQSTFDPETALGVAVQQAKEIAAELEQVDSEARTRLERFPQAAQQHRADQWFPLLNDSIPVVNQAAELLQRLRDMPATQRSDWARDVQLPAAGAPQGEDQPAANPEALSHWQATARVLELGIDQLGQLQLVLATLGQQPGVEPFVATTLSQWEQQITGLAGRLVEVQQEATKLQNEARRRAERRTQITEQVAAARAELDALNADPVPTTPGLPPGARQVNAAERLLERTQRLLLDQQIHTFQSELVYYDATGELLPLQRDRAVQRAANNERHNSRLRDLLNTRRRLEAERQASEAMLAVEESARRLDNKEINRLLEGNRELFNQRREVSDQIQSTQDILDAATESLKKLTDDKSKIMSQFGTSGLTNVTGTVLREQRTQLPDIRELRRRRQQIDAAAGEAMAELYALQRARDQLATLDVWVEEFMEQVQESTSLRRGMLRNALEKTLTSRRDVLDSLITDYVNYTDKLAQLNKVLGDQITEATEFSTFIDERVLWIRSSPPLSVKDFSAAAKQAVSLVTNPQWLPTIGLLIEDGTSVRNGGLGIWLLMLVVLLPVIYFQQRLRRRLTLLGEQAAKSSADRIGPTFKALLLTLILASIGPGILLFISWRLSAATAPTNLALAVADGLRIMAIVWFPAEVLRKTCRNRGLADAHFSWPRNSIRLVRRQLRWLVLIGLPVVFIVAAAWEAPTRAASSAVESPLSGLITVTSHLQEATDSGDETLARLCFIVGMLSLAFFVWRLLRPSSGVLAQTLATHRDGWLYRLRYAWFSCAVAAPLILAVFAIAGFYYTALELAMQLLLTLAFALALVICNSILLRWLLLAKRNLARQQAMARRAALQAEAAQQADDDEADSTTAEALPSIEQEMVNITAVSEQSRQLLRFTIGITAAIGIFAIWGHVLPALGMLDQWKVYEVAIEPTTTSTPAANGTAGTTSSTTPAPDAAAPATTVRTTTTRAITLDLVLLAVLILVMLIVAIKNIPGLLEISLLPRLPMDAGSRYAVTTLSRYIIVVVGVLAISNVLSIGWSKVQWLVAAVSFGLGFGMQEIFANFVSGLILLFERPIRVGDLVTVDGVSGTVTKIRSRATTIVDWDRKELIVPNKEFITGRLVNWTLTDQVTRLILTVGVAHGTDPNKVQMLLIKIAKGCPWIMEEPGPSAAFEEFADSTLIFRLRVFLPNTEKMLATRHEINSVIVREFAAEGIKIAFPQRDLHIRSIDTALAITQQPPGGNGAAVPRPTNPGDDGDPRTAPQEPPAKEPTKRTGAARVIE